MIKIKFNFLRTPLLILMIANYIFTTSCIKSNNCNWADRINDINEFDEEKSLWHTINKIEPIFDKNTKGHSYKKDYFMKDFRQFELISKKYKSIVERQIKEADKYKRNYKRGNGYRKVYVRDQIPKPIIKPIELNALKEILDLKQHNDLVFRSCKDLKVKNGFLFDKQYARIVGYTNNKENVEVLCINNFSHENEEFKINLKKLMQKLDCIFVNYIDGEIYTEETILDYDSIY